MELLQGRVAVVTGAGRGIGASIAKMMAAEGASVVVNDLGVAVDGTQPTSGPAHEVAAEIVADGGAAVADTTDIVSFSGVERLVQSAVDNFGKLDVVVNVAGILRDRMIFNMSEEEWDSVLAVHLKGTFNTTRHAAAYWRAHPDPTAQRRLINFTSGAGTYGSAGQPNYSAAKAGVIGLTWSCAKALQRYGVTANAVSPGADTRMQGTIPSERWSAIAARVGATKRAEGEANPRAPENVAKVVVFLASVQSGWCNGRIIQTRGYEIVLHSNLEPLRHIVSTGPLDLDQTFQVIERVFRPVVETSPAATPTAVVVAAADGGGKASAASKVSAQQG